MTNRAPRFRYAAQRFGQRHSALSFQILRVDGDPDGGPFGFRTSSQGIDLETFIADLRLILSAMKASDQPDEGRPEALARDFSNVAGLR